MQAPLVVNGSTSEKMIHPEYFTVSVGNIPIQPTEFRENLLEKTAL